MTGDPRFASWRGGSLAESLAVLTLLALALAIVAPAVARGSNEARTAAGAREIALTFQALRWQSVTRARACGLRFVRDARGWSWIEVEDGNGNGLRSAEIASGVDPVRSGPWRLEQRVRGVRLGFPPGGPFPSIPPARGPILRLDEPVRFSSAGLVSFAPLGTATSGSLYVTDERRTLYAVVLYGPTARVRVWRYDEDGGQWTL